LLWNEIWLNWFSPKNLNQEKKLENQEVLKAIAVLADKVSRYHERLLATERDNLRLEKTLSEHLKGCGCHDTSDEKVMLNGNETEIECEACSA
jgi:hypothetical protein